MQIDCCMFPHAAPTDAETALHAILPGDGVAVIWVV